MKQLVWLYKLLYWYMIHVSCALITIALFSDQTSSSHYMDSAVYCYVHSQTKKLQPITNKCLTVPWSYWIKWELYAVFLKQVRTPTCLPGHAKNECCFQNYFLEWIQYVLQNSANNMQIVLSVSCFSDSQIATNNMPLGSSSLQIICLETKECINWICRIIKTDMSC